MRISGKCTTYGRVNFLEEALYGFLQQDYDDWNELVIVNDYPLQKLHFDHPRVRIFNLDETFPIIGQKENFAIEQCQGDIVAVLDDDDLSMPNHFSNIRKYWQPDTNLLQWNNAAFYNFPNITKLMGVGNSGIVFSKDVWERVGRSPIENAGGDMTFVMSIYKLGHVVKATPPDEEISWFYRWSLPATGYTAGVYHQSGNGTDTPDRENIVQRHVKFIENQRRIGKIPTGDIELKPKWRQDYQQLLKDFIKNKKQ